MRVGSLSQLCKIRFEFIQSAFLPVQEHCLLLNLAMLFKKLIEQRCVRFFVVDGEGLAFSMPRQQ